MRICHEQPHQDCRYLKTQTKNNTATNIANRRGKLEKILTFSMTPVLPRCCRTRMPGACLASSTTASSTGSPYTLLFGYKKVLHSLLRVFQQSFSLAVFRVFSPSLSVLLVYLPSPSTSPSPRKAVNSHEEMARGAHCNSF